MNPRKKATTTSHWSSLLPDPCPDGLAWALSQPSLQSAWRSCNRGDWMLWYATHAIDATAADHQRALWLIRADIADTVLHLYERQYPDDPRIRNCISTIRQYADGNTCLSDLAAAHAAAASVASVASAAAHAASVASVASVAAHAASVAAAHAASVASVASVAAHAASVAAASVASVAASYTVDSSSYYNHLSLCADIVRRHLPTAPRME